MGLFSQLLSFFLLFVWFDSQCCDATESPTNGPSTFYCGLIPCKAPAQCCTDNNGCCSFTQSNTDSKSSGLHWSIVLVITLVVIGVIAGIFVMLYFWRKRGGNKPYFRST